MTSLKTALTRAIGRLTSLFGRGLVMARRLELLRQLDDIEQSVHRIVVPASFGDLFYALRGHIEFVRRKLTSVDAAAPADSAGERRLAVAELSQRVAGVGDQPA